MMKNLLLSLLLITGLASCTTNATIITISPKVSNPDIIGNGAEWDPYCEAVQWGSPLTDQMWATIFERTDKMGMSIVRCMINSPFRYYDKKTGSFKKEQNSESLLKVLEYCQKNNIAVMYGEFNPPAPELKKDPKWIKMSIEYLNYLVADCGFTCIRFFIPTNEPDGNWSMYDGDYQMYRDIVEMFNKEIKSYPALASHIRFAAPDVVLGYKNPKYDMDNSAWISRTSEIDSLVGVYEIHAYPGYKQVRSGEFARMFREVVQNVPKGKKIILGEAGYKPGREEDSLENKSHFERLQATPLIENKEGADCNMRVYDFEYGLDMALLAMEVMNNGGAGVAVWMLDDSHSVGDTGEAKNLKIWGMWNIFGEKVWKMKDEEKIRPWYYAWSLMCKYFPAGSDILTPGEILDKDIKVVAAVKDDKLTIALLNLSTEKKVLHINLPKTIQNASMYTYKKDAGVNDYSLDPVRSGLTAEKVLKTDIAACSLLVVTEL